MVILSDPTQEVLYRTGLPNTHKQANAPSQDYSGFSIDIKLRYRATASDFTSVQDLRHSHIVGEK